MRRNRILNGLVDDELTRLLAVADEVALAQGDVVQRAGGTSRWVHFPVSGLYSYVRTNTRGTSTEVAVIGREGVLALPLVVNIAAVPFDLITQVGGHAVRVSREAFDASIASTHTLSTLVFAFVEGLLLQSMETTACNRLHSTDERCARWLLVSRARLGSDVVPLTHEFLALMLGTSRARVSVVLGKLQRRGLIDLDRGRIIIRDLPGLRRLACDCASLDLGCAEPSVFRLVPIAASPAR